MTEPRSADLVAAIELAREATLDAAVQDTPYAKGHRDALDLVLRWIGNLPADDGDRYGDGTLRGMHRTAVAQPDEPWPAHVVASLVDEIIRLRGRDTAWLAIHPAHRDGRDDA